MKIFSLKNWVVFLLVFLLFFAPRILYSSEIFSVQAGAFSSKKNAINLIENLKKAGIKCTINETAGLCKVYCGEFNLESDAYALRGEMSSKGYDGGFIIRVDSSIKQSVPREVAPALVEKMDEKTKRPDQEEISKSNEKKDMPVDKEVVKKIAEKADTKDISLTQKKATTYNPSQREKGKWNVQLEPMWMIVKGNDVHIGDIFNYKEVLDGTTLRYGTTYDSIRLDLKDKLTLRTEITYMMNQWGLGINGWWFNTEVSQEGMISTPPEVVTPTGYIYYEKGVRMWDNTIIPVENELFSSSFSPVDYWTRNELEVWTADLYGIKKFVEKDGSHIGMIFGLKLGSLDNNRKEGQKQHEYCTNCLIDVLGVTVDEWDNHITLESTSKADYGLMVGPVIGFQGKASFQGLYIEGLINQSLLSGKVKQTGLWRDIDDAEYIDGGVPGELFLDGRFPFSKNETVLLPITELKLKVVYEVDPHRNISIGLGGFTSIWWNAPIAPKWSIPGAWTWDEGTGWRLQEHTLTFYGVMAALNVGF